jgi:hypothetical protein
MRPVAADAVGAIHTRWWNALLAADVGTLDTLLADDLTFHSPYGTAETKAAFLANLRAGRLKYDSIADDAPLTRLHGQTAIMTGRADIQFQWEGEPVMERLYYTAVYGWTPPHWRMRAWQSTIRDDAEG